MRYLVIHKVDEKMEAGLPPDAGIMQGMGRLVGEGLKSGVFVDGAGLHRSAQRVRVTCRAGDCTTEAGPYAGRNELVGAVAMIKTASMDAAIACARRFAGVLGDVEIGIGPVVEP